MQDKEELILIDADSIYFKAACKTKLEKQIKKIIDSLMNDIQSQCMMGVMKVAVKGVGNFRKDIAKDYKGNRPNLDQDLKDALNVGRHHMIKRWGAVAADGMEADDLVSIWAYEARDMELFYTVVGIDKDLLQIPGNHYNFNKRVHRIIDDDEGYKLLMLQCLTGDRGDNIPGIRGIGPKKAEKILEGINTKDMWKQVQLTWQEHNAGSPDVSLRLLSMIKTWEEYESIKSSIQNETTECKQNTGSEGKELLQEPSLCSVSERDSRVTERSKVAFRG